MSKSHAKATDTKAKEAPTPAPPAGGDTGAPAVVSAAAPAAPPQQHDKHAGKGGLYRKGPAGRKLVERTQQPTTATTTQATKE